jgi:hypothetical protein
MFDAFEWLHKKQGLNLKVMHLADVLAAGWD